MTNYELLISRLDAFIRKYYANQVIRGSLIFLSCLLLYVLSVSVGEYLLYMPVWLRLGLISLFIMSGISALVIWILIPLTKMNRLGKIISHEQAATIVGAHFPEISDKLLNILQLRSHADDHASRQLIEASINQKAQQISVVPITKAIDLSQNKRYLRFLLPVLLAGLFILVAAPNVFREASDRLLQPTKIFEKPAPFQFIVTNTNMLVVRNADYTLKVETQGAALPAEMSVDMGAEKVPMMVAAPNKFEYTFKNVTGDLSFRLHAAGFYSKTYTLKVVQKPVLKSFKVLINYPDYIGKKDEIRNSLGDMSLPVGTKVNWIFNAEYTDKMFVRMGSGGLSVLPLNSYGFAYQFRFINDTNCTFILQNNHSPVTDSYTYHVQVIPDQYPVVQVQEQRDTVSGTQILLNGSAGDDYGISKVLFHYEILGKKNEQVAKKAILLKTSPGAMTSFQQYFDVQTLNLLPGQKLTYYIEAWDNDGVHGSKASRSEIMSYQEYNDKELDSAINENSKQINSGISNSAQKTQQLQSDYKDMQSKMLQSENMDWEQQQSLKEMAKKQEQLQTQVENIKKRFEEQVQQSKQKDYSEDLKDKQNELQKQLDNLLNNELKEQMKKLQELMQKLNKEQAMQAMQQLEQDNKLFDMDLKRIQELMKKMEMEMRMEDLANKMESLAKKQTDLKEQTDKARKDNKALGKEQNDLKKELQSAMKEDMKEMKELADKMKEKESLEDPKKEGEEAEQNMEQSEQELGDDKKSESSKSQSKAAKNLEQMAQMLREKAGGMGLEQIEIDIQATRQLLSNLIRLSFDQEALFNKAKGTSVASANYLENMQEQKRLHGNSQMIRDSLFVLSKRVFSLSSAVNKETTDIEKNMKASTDALENRNISDAITKQQFVMTHTNNLALMLNELLANMIQMQGEQQGAGSCNKPGGKRPKPGSGKPKAGAGQQLGDIITQQQKLGNAMQQMQNAKQMREGQGKQPDKSGKDGKEGQQGQQPNGQGQGNNGSGEGEYGDAEQLARMAEQQASLRRKLQELNSLLNSKGLGNARMMQEIQQKMDKTETDIVNRWLNSELMLRQKEILSRLLEAEKSLREQEQDDKRSSRSAEEMSRPVPPELQKYMQDKRYLLEQYKTVPPQLKPYYRNMVEQYFKSIGK